MIHVLETDAQDIDLFTGRIDEEKVGALMRSGFLDAEDIDTAFICGPEPMMLGIAAGLKAAGLAEDQIKFELFASSQPGRLAKRVISKEAAKGGNQAQIVVTLDGSTRTVDASKELSVLDAARAGNLDAPYSCKARVCSTCRCRVIEGEVEMVTNHALEDYEVEKGYVLSCQSFPVTDRVVVDYDQ